MLMTLLLSQPELRVAGDGAGATAASGLGLGVNARALLSAPLGHLRTCEWEGGDYPHFAGLKDFPLLLLLCVAYAASSLSVHVCVCVCLCLCGSIKTTIIVIHTPQANTPRHTLLRVMLVHETFNFKIEFIVLFLG